MWEGRVLENKEGRRVPQAIENRRRLQHGSKGSKIQAVLFKVGRLKALQERGQSPTIYERARTKNANVRARRRAFQVVRSGGSWERHAATTRCLLVERRSLGDG